MMEMMMKTPIIDAEYELLAVIGYIVATVFTIICTRLSLQKFQENPSTLEYTSIIDTIILE